MPKPKRPDFFKVFLEHVSYEMMKIPPGFCKYMENKKSRVMCLKGPSGNTCKIDLIENPEGLYFGEEGWKTFWKDHSVETGHFFVCKFDGEGVFLCASGRAEPSATNPPSFVYSVHQEFYFVIRKEFNEKYRRHYGSRAEVVLCCGGEDKYKEWTVTVIRESGCVISKGWLSFRNDNQLKKGDMLRFEMVGDFRFDVHKI